MTRRKRSFVVIAAVVAGLVSFGTAQAFTHRLSSEQVREAYFLGRDPERRQTFFDRYIHFPKQPDKGPDVHLVEFRTPYELVARRAQEHWANCDVLDAEQEYAKQPDEVIVRVLICATYTFGYGAPPQNLPPGKTWENYLKGFEFRVSQTSPIEYKNLTLLGAGCASFDDASFGGADVLLHFDADQFAEGAVRIDVATPDAHVVSTTFDLDSLK